MELFVIRVSEVLSNTLYLFALNYYFIITFLGYNALPFLHHTELLLAPIAVTTILWFASLFGFNMSRHFAPVLWAGARLRKHVNTTTHRKFGLGSFGLCLGIRLACVGVRCTFVA
jgi:hypothetical protein